MAVSILKTKTIFLNESKFVMTENTTTSEAIQAAAQTEDQQLKGRSIFLIETVPVGVSVRTAFMTEDEQLLQMPSLFPDLAYALDQIDQLRAGVIRHFDQAAQVGAQVIAEQARLAAVSNVANAEKTESISGDTNSHSSVAV